MKQPDLKEPNRLGKKWLGPVKRLLCLMALLLGLNPGFCGDSSFTEYQVKALFLLNFTKYVDWPPAAFAETNSPIIIGLYGEDKFGDALKQAVEGKTIGGRRIVIQPVEKGGDPGKCHMLFISDSETDHLGEILDKIKALPVLTVGETDQFMEQGGMINFVKKEGKIRLEINLDAARQAGLEISSKLLNVADVVKGKLK
jgi:hypothetical protein